MVEQYHENPNNSRLSNNLSCGLNTVKLKQTVTVLWRAKMVVVKLEKIMRIFLNLHMWI